MPNIVGKRCYESVEPVTPSQMRAAWSNFCSGVTVITAAGPDGPLGFTCQSFSSLSLDPPLVSFNPARSSTTWPQIREVGRFCVNLLAHEHENLSAAFARSGGQKFAGVSWRPGPAGSPILDGVLAWAECTTWAEYDGGDHTIVAARVDSLEHDLTSSPLVFYRGSYGVSSLLGRE